MAKPSDASKKYVDDNIFAKIREKYHQMWGKLHTNIPKPTVSSESFNATMSGPQCKSTSELKLPKVELPTFSGKYEEWMAFNNMFTATVHNNTMMEPIVKLQRLKRALTGDAELIVRNLELNDDNYMIARNLLINRFQHTRRLVNSYLKRLYDLPIIKTESAKNLRSVLNTLNDCTSALKQLDLTIEDYQLVYHMCRKLPQSFLTAWEESQGASTALPTFEKFLTFIETRFRMMEMIEPADNHHRSFHVNSNQNLKGKNKNQSSSNNTGAICFLCNGSHKLEKCEKFNKMDQSSRFEVVKSNRACINCLDLAHHTRSCKSKHRCRVCHRSHHTLLHRYNSTPQPGINGRQDISSNYQAHTNNSQEPSPVQHNQILIMLTRWALQHY